MGTVRGEGNCGVLRERSPFTPYAHGAPMALGTRAGEKTRDLQFSVGQKRGAFIHHLR